MKTIVIISAIVVYSNIAWRAAESFAENVQGPTPEDQRDFTQSNTTTLGLLPSSFSASPQAASSRLLAATKYMQMDNGRSVGKGELSQPVADAVERLGHIVLPRVEFCQADPKDILRFIATALTMPEPDKTQSIGLIHDEKETGVSTTGGQATELINELSLCTTPVTCSLQRVNLLEFIEHFSKAMKVDVGLTQEGQIIFGCNDKWSSRGQPAYLVQFAE